MTPAQEYASDFAKRVAMGIIPEQTESVRLRIDDFERYIAIAFLAGSQHALDVQIEMVNQSVRDMNSRPRVQAPKLAREEYVAKGKALEIDWIGTPQMMVDKMRSEGKVRDILSEMQASEGEVFQASEPAVFDRSVLDKPEEK